MIDWLTDKPGVLSLSCNSNQATITPPDLGFKLTKHHHHLTKLSSTHASRTMADVDMTDAPSGSTAPIKKTTAKSKAGGDGGADGKKRFEVKKVRGNKPWRSICDADAKKWNAVALWAWDIVVDNCAICRNHIMDLCAWEWPILLRSIQC